MRTFLLTWKTMLTRESVCGNINLEKVIYIGPLSTGRTVPRDKKSTTR